MFNIGKIEVTEIKVMRQSNFDISSKLSLVVGHYYNSIEILFRNQFSLIIFPDHLLVVHKSLLHQFIGYSIYVSVNLNILTMSILTRNIMTLLRIC